MVIDEQDHSDHGSDGPDIDAVSHFTEKFDEETVAGTEMAVSVHALFLSDGLIVVGSQVVRNLLPAYLDPTLERD
jgi:hypothetical protein